MFGQTSFRSENDINDCQENRFLLNEVLKRSTQRSNSSGNCGVSGEGGEVSRGGNMQGKVATNREGSPSSCLLW